MLILQAGYVVPGSVGGDAACGWLRERIALLRARGSSRGGRCGGLLPSWIRRVSVAKLALHPHLQKLQRPRDDVTIELVIS